MSPGWHFGPGEWAIAILGALLVGVSKTGVSGLGMLFVVLFAQILPARQATGIVLPLLCCGDFVAAAAYHRHARWPHLVRLFPWAALGVIAGSGALHHIDDRQTRLLIGLIILLLIGMHLWRRHRRADQVVIAAWWFPPLLGVLAGFTTLIANAAGPLMVIYLLAMRLPKLEYVGTGAIFFLLLNLFKVPFMVALGLINPASLTVNLWLAPAVLAGAWLGKRLLARLNQELFENVALALSALAGLRLLF